jgi:hypothetical protein
MPITVRRPTSMLDDVPCRDRVSRNGRRRGVALAATSHPRVAPIHSEVWTPLWASVYVADLDEHVTITGDLHIVSDVRRGVETSTVDLYANIADGQAVGQTSGDHYQLTGAAAHPARHRRRRAVPAAHPLGPEARLRRARPAHRSPGAGLHPVVRRMTEQTPARPARNRRSAHAPDP